MTTKKRKQLMKSNDRIIGGVFGGIAEYFNVDKTFVRLIGVVILFFSHFFPFIMIYILLMLIIPRQSRNVNGRNDGSRFYSQSGSQSNRAGGSPFYKSTANKSQSRKDVTPGHDDEWSDF